MNNLFFNKLFKIRPIKLQKMLKVIGGIDAIRQVIDNTVFKFYGVESFGLKPNVIDVGEGRYEALWWADDLDTTYDLEVAMDIAGTMKHEMISELTRRNVNASVTPTILRDEFMWNGTTYNCKNLAYGDPIPFIVQLDVHLLSSDIGLNKK
jgi:hypothetical protein